MPKEAYGLLLEYIDFLIFKFNHNLVQQEDSPEEYDDLLKELLINRIVSHKENPKKGTSSDELKAKLSAKYGW